MTKTLLPSGVKEPKPIIDITRGFDAQVQEGRLEGYLPVPTGFSSEDEFLGGGFLCGCLMLLSGRQNIGKTIKLLQYARNVALGGDISCMVCYEHGEVELFHRLLCMESYLSSSDRQGITLVDIRKAILAALPADGNPEELSQVQALQAVLQTYPAARRAFDEHMAQYLENLYLISGDPRRTTLQVLESYVYMLKEEHGSSGMGQKGKRVVLFADYLQRIPFDLDSYGMDRDREADLVTRGLKNLAKEEGIPIVAVSALDKRGLRKNDYWVEDMQGSPSLQYEPDTALMMYPYRSKDRFDVGFAFGKNRAGPTNVEILYSLIGQHFAFDPEPSEVRQHQFD